MTQYNPRPIPKLDMLDDLHAWLTDELRILSRQLSETTEVELRPIYRAPDKPREGMIVCADGTSWNPGGGKGIYAYLSGAWSKL